MSLKEVLTQLQETLRFDSFEIRVRRQRVLEDILKESRKRKFHPLKRVTVCVNIIIKPM